MIFSMEIRVENSDFSVS